MKETIIAGLIIACIGWVGSEVVNISRTMLTNSTKLETMRSDIAYLKDEVIEQGKDIAAIKAEISEEELASLPLDPNRNGG